MPRSQHHHLQQDLYASGCGYAPIPGTLPGDLGKSQKGDYGRNKEQPLGHDVLQTPAEHTHTHTHTQHKSPNCVCTVGVFLERLKNAETFFPKAYST